MFKALRDDFGFWRHDRRLPIESPERASRFLRDKWPFAILLLVAALPYIGVLRNDFAYAYDDKALILDNPYLHSFGHLGELLTTDIWSYQASHGMSNYFRPVEMIGFLLCYKVFGPWAGGFHLLSLLLNISVVILLFLLAERMLGGRPAAFAASAIFALHPVHVEAVAWIAAMTDLEMTFFFILTFWLFLRLEDRTCGQNWIAWTAMIGSYVLALLSKEPAMTLAPLATVYEHGYRADRAGTNWREKVFRYGPLWLACLGYTLVRVHIFKGFAHPSGYHTFTAGEVLLSGLAVLGGYLALLVWPLNLAELHLFHPSVRIDWHVLGGLLAVAVALVAFGALWKRARITTFPILWFFAALTPALDARWLGDYVLAHRHLYLPSAGFCLFAGWACDWLWRGIANRGMLVRSAALTAGLLLAAFCVFRISTRVRDWRSDITLFQRALAANPGDYRIHDSLGFAYWIRGDGDNAEREWQETLRLEPNNVGTLEELGALYASQKNFAQAIPLLEMTSTLDPLNSNAHLQLGAAYAETGNPEGAEKQWLKAAQISPMNYITHNLLGKLYFDSKQFNQAEQQFLQSLQCQPNLAADDYLGYIYMQEGRRDLAEQVFKAALALNNTDSHAHFDLGLIYSATGRTSLAVEELQAALAADPSNPEIRSALAKLHH